MLQRIGLAVILVMSACAYQASAADLRVPKDFKTIQAAIDVAKPGDIVFVEAGTYREQVKLKERITLKSVGDDASVDVPKGPAGTWRGLKRAAATVIEHAGDGAKGPAVIMAAGSVLNGFTVTKAGLFDQKEYDLHYATFGDLLADERGAVGLKEFPALGIPGVTATVRFCIIRDNGHAGIGVTGDGNKSHIYKNVVYRNMGGGIGIANGASPTIEANTCFNNLRGGIGNRKSKAVIINNESFDNVRAGIGIREGSTPIVRGNKCYKNRRAGIGVRMEGTNPIIEDNDCYENEMAGIGNRDGAAPIIRNNRCFKNKMAGIGSRDGARGIIQANECYENMMAGIGSRLGAAPTIRFNKCYKNKMAGIGSREFARPIIEGNECFENEMAGIGSRDGAEPVIRANKCYRNEMAGIGSRLGAKALIVDNDCYENLLAGIGSREGAMPIIKGNRSYKNELAGIGSRDGAFCIIEGNISKENKFAGIGVRNGAVVMLMHNQCIENRLVAVGVRHGSAAYILDNEFVRTGGMPPMIAIREGSSALIVGNTIKGGGVAGVIIDGVGRIRANRFVGTGKNGSAVWGWGKADLTIVGNDVDGYRNLVNSTGNKVAILDNIIRNFQGTAITVKKPLAPPMVAANVAVSNNPKDKVAVVEGAAPMSKENIVRDIDNKSDLRTADEAFWAALKGKAKYERPELIGEQSVEDAGWKLVVVHGKTTAYRLYHIASDPQMKKNLAPQIDNLVLRLRGKMEREEAIEYKTTARKDAGK